MSTQTFCPGQAGYPASLLDLPDPPLLLHVRGALDLTGPRVAVVGTRRPSERGRRLAHELGAGLAAAGVTVVSGGALGIDGAAHRGALEARGTTWVVLPSPLSAPLPASHRGLFREVLEGGGAWLSELEAGVGKHAYFERNRLVAALAHVVVAVEAELRSGTQHTMQAALRLGRARAAFPWAVGDAYGDGCLAWIKEGAAMVRGTADVLDVLAGVPGAPQPAPRAAAGRHEDPLLAALADGPARPEVLAAQLGVPVTEILARLSLLEITQVVSAHSGGVFRLRSPVAEGRG
ncbi:MAG: DNA-processing protein DprA [Deltaproteobacteria bacterium]|nr:DNA-processing protein DprA [Deltaproteobacteria bacterium]